MLILGDLHLQENWIKEKQVKLFFEWLNSQSFIKTENTIILLGDLFEIPTPNSQLVSSYLDLFANKWKSKTIYILQGNHDYNLETNSLDFFNFLDNVKVLKDKTELQIENKSCLFLPYYSHENTNKEPMHIFYSSLEGDYDYIFGHLEDKTQHFGNNFCDLSKIKGKRYFGHIHTPDIQKNGNYLGSCIKNSSTEKDDQKYVAIIKEDSEKLIEIPSFMSYKTLEFGEELEDKNTLTLLNILDAPSKPEAVNLYENRYTNVKCNKIITKRQKMLETSKVVKDSEEFSWNEFCKEKSVKDDVKKICEATFKLAI